MIPLTEYFHSVERIWALWGGSLLLLLWLTRKAVQGLRKQSEAKPWRAVFQEEDGAAYSLSYVLVFPIYLMLVLLVIECTLILIVKLGTLYAAYAAARSQIVFFSLVGEPMANDRADRSAIQAMAPYSSSWESHLRKAGADGLPTDQADQYFQAFQAYSSASANYRRYVVNKYRWAQWATSGTYQRKLLGSPEETWNADITATISFKRPFHAPVIGRFLGQRFDGPGGPIYLRTITSSVTLQDEAPQNRPMKLGVQFSP